MRLIFYKDIHFEVNKKIKKYKEINFHFQFHIFYATVTLELQSVSLKLGWQVLLSKVHICQQFLRKDIIVSKKILKVCNTNRFLTQTNFDNYNYGLIFMYTNVHLWQ